MLIAFEGLGGSGKTTQVGLLKGKLVSYGFSVASITEPTTGDIGNLIRRALSGNARVSDLALRFLFLADRANHLEELRDKLSRFDIVLSDRNFFSNIAYGLLSIGMDDLVFLEELIFLAGVRRPDINIFLDLHPELCLRRIDYPEIYESRLMLRTIRGNYFTAFSRYSSECLEVIDGGGSIDDVGCRVFNFISSRRFFKVFNREGSYGQV